MESVDKEQLPSVEDFFSESDVEVDVVNVSFCGLKLGKYSQGLLPFFENKQSKYLHINLNPITRHGNGRNQRSYHDQFATLTINKI